MTLLSDIQGLEPGSQIELFELDASGIIGGDVLRFHGYPTEEPIIWNGMQFDPWAIEATGFARTGTGVLPTPVLRVGNTNGVVSALCLALDDLISAKLTRYRTLLQYMDDPTQQFPLEVWLVEAKTMEDKTWVEFELSSALDFEGQQLPGEQINANMCRWLVIGGYRGPHCAYMGTNMFDADDNPVTDPSFDKCGGRVTSCKKRFGEWDIINIGAYPAADQMRGY